MAEQHPPEQARQEANEAHKEAEHLTVARSVVSSATARKAFAGAIIGLATGLILGWLHGTNRLPIAGLAPMAASGSFESMLVGGGVLGSLGALVGGFWGLSQETRPPRSEPQPLMALAVLPVVVALGLVLLYLFGLARIAWLSIGGGEFPPPSSRVHWQTKNSSRVAGSTPDETIRQAIAIAYPGRAPRMLIHVPDDWRFALAATPLLALPTDGALAIGPGDTNAWRTLSAGSSMLSVGPSPAWAPGTPSLPATTPAAAAAALDAERIRQVGISSTRILLVNADAPAAWGLPAAAWAARTGDPILFLERQRIPPETRQAILRRGDTPYLVVMGAPLLDAGVLRELAGLGTMIRVDGDTPEAAAAHFAQLYDPSSGTGWGYGTAPANFLANRNTLIANPDHWREAIGSSVLARGTGKSGPMLLTERDRVPAVTDTLLWKLRPRFEGTPAEGPFNHAWILGGLEAISYPTQGWIDYSQEIESYKTLGDTAMSGWEAGTIVWIAMGLACALWIAVHAARALPEVSLIMRTSWAILALMLGPLGLALYLAAYHRRPMRRHGEMTMWKRPFWLQVLSATAMTFALDMFLMILVVYTVAWVTGFPTLTVPDNLAWLGNSMTWMMILMFAIAFLVMWAVFHTPMVMHEQKLSYPQALKAGLPGMGWSMVAESLGMMPVMWWLMMWWVPAMEMPDDEKILFWGILLASVLAGAVTAALANIWMVKKGIKSGLM